MDATPNLTLPFIMAAQAQKHVTHNEALGTLDAIVQLAVLDKDLSAPPGSPADGARYIVPSGATGAWAGHTSAVAAFQDGAWVFRAPNEGWLAWAADEDSLYVYTGSAWTAFAGGGLANVVDDTTPQLGGDLDGNGHSIGFDDATGLTDDAGNEQLVLHKTAGAVNQLGITNAATGTAPQLAAEGGDANISLQLRGKGTGFVDADKLGINAVADTTNRLALKSAASLFDNAGAGHQQKINKAASADTASQMFQTAYSSRAEYGLTGDDDFHIKVSPDGTTWADGLIIDRTSGAARFPNTAYVDLPAGSAPATPASGKVRLYAKTDKSLYQKDDAGLETGLAGGGSSGVNPNLLINADGRIDQRNAGAAATTADDAYGSSDRWYSLTQTASITVQRLADGENGMPFYQQLKQTQATAQRMGRAQIIESANCRHARGQSLTLSGRIRCSASQAIRYAILEWTGTADAVTSDVVSSWTNATFTAGQFFNSTTLNVLGVGAITPSADTWTDLTALTATAGASLNNLIVLIWTEGTAAQNVTLDLRLKLEVASAATAFVPRPFVQELSECLRYFEKSAPQETAVGTASDGSNSVVLLTASVAQAALYYLGSFKVRKRAAPAMTIYPYTTPANTGRVSQANGTDYGASSGALSYSSELSFAIFNNTGGAMTIASNLVVFGWYADAEL